MNCLLTGAFRSFADIFIYVTNNKFLCINLHNYIYFFFKFNSFKNSSAHTMQNCCKIGLFATVSTSISRRSPTSLFRTTPLDIQRVHTGATLRLYDTKTLFRLHPDRMLSCCLLVVLHGVWTFGLGAQYFEAISGEARPHSFHNKRPLLDCADMSMIILELIQ